MENAGVRPVYRYNNVQIYRYNHMYRYRYTNILIYREKDIQSLKNDAVKSG